MTPDSRHRGFKVKGFKTHDFFLQLQGSRPPRFQVSRVKRSKIWMLRLQMQSSRVPAGMVLPSQHIVHRHRSMATSARKLSSRLCLFWSNRKRIQTWENACVTTYQKARDSSRHSHNFPTRPPSLPSTVHLLQYGSTTLIACKARLTTNFTSTSLSALTAESRFNTLSAGSS